jgi:2-keto-4-pentenoate hydratase/2-oxohepta-3-ene-1,7-dioic acid hydratase in catechol pathway
MDDARMTSTPYALGTFAGPDGRQFGAIVLGDGAWELEPRVGRGVRGLLEDWATSLPLLQRLADSLVGAPEHDVCSLRPLPPVSPPGQVFQAGANYRQHLIELTNAGPDRMHRELSDEERSRALASIDERARDGAPYVFLGLPHAVVGAEDQVQLPYGLVSVDWELELAAVIGARARHVPREAAYEVIAGYTICNDITARDLIFRSDVAGIGTDWLAGKNWPTFLPTGPVLVPATHVADPMDVRITLRLNGDVMQDCSTSDMMFDIARLVEHVSAITELRPGDMLLTGSPSGNGVFHDRFLTDGDVIESEITGLGRQLNRCVAEPAPGARGTETAQTAQA